LPGLTRQSNPQASHALRRNGVDDDAVAYGSSSVSQ
jgi:hypothetical protein